MRAKWLTCPHPALSPRRLGGEGIREDLLKDRLLALETSSPRLSLAAGTFEKVLATYEGPMQWRHAESLFEGLEKLLGDLNWPVRSLGGVAVSVGPGSFTGIRIGLAAARTLGQARASRS